MEKVFNFEIEVAPRNGRASRMVAIKGNAQEFVEEATIERFSNVERLAEKASWFFGIKDKKEDFLRWLYPRLRAEAERVDAEAEQIAKNLVEQEAGEGDSDWQPSSEAITEAERLLTSPRLLAEVVDAIQLAGVVGERALTALAYLVSTSRLAGKPLYLLVQGPPSSGKSFTLEKTAEVLPPQLVLSITDATANALFYLSDPSALRHKVLLLGEKKRQLAEESIDATKALRELVESGRLTKLVPVKAGDGLQTIKLELQGAPAILETASHGAIPYEDLTRMIQAWPDESEAQTRRVIQALADKKASGGAGLPEGRRDAIRAIQLLLEPQPVVIPFLPALAERFPAKVTEARRAFARLVGLIEAVALLHQRQRERQGGSIVAVEDDARLAWRLLAPWIKHRLVEAPPPAVLKLWAVIRNRGRVTQTELGGLGIASRPTVRQAVKFLTHVGAIEVIDHGTGKTKEIVVKNPDWQPADLDIFQEVESA